MAALAYTVWYKEALTECQRLMILLFIIETSMIILSCSMPRIRIVSGLSDTLGLLLAHKTKHIAGDTAHLYFVGTLGDAVAAVVAINMFEVFVPRITQPTVYLHGLVGGIAAQPVGRVITHRHFVGD